MAATMTPRARRRKAVSEAMQQATLTCRNQAHDMWHWKFERALEKSGYRIGRMSTTQLRQRAAEELRSVEVAGAPHRN